MAFPPVMGRIIAEANRIYNQTVRNADPANDEGLNWKMSEAFNQFNQELIKLYSELKDALSQFAIDVGVYDPLIDPRYLHLFASIPWQSDGEWQVTIPNQDNVSNFTGAIGGKGRIHCVSLGHSYLHSSIKMKVHFLDQYFQPGIETIIIDSNGTSWSSSDVPPNFWHAYAWHDAFMEITPSHAVCKHYYFEKYGHTSKSKYVQFLVKSTSATPYFHSSACAWESDSPHETINWEMNK